MNGNGSHKPHMQPSRNKPVGGGSKVKISMLMKALILFAGIYIGWFLFIIQNLNEHSINNKNTIKNRQDLNMPTGNIRSGSSSSSSSSSSSHSDHLSLNLPLENDKHEEIHKADDAVDTAAITKMDDLDGEKNLDDLARDDDDPEAVKSRIDDEELDELESKMKHDNGSNNGGKADTTGIAADTVGGDSVVVDTSNTSCNGQRCIQLQNFQFNTEKAEKAAIVYSKKQTNNRKIKPLRAYLEPPMKDEIPNTGRKADYDNPKDDGDPSEYVKPLPIRKTTPSELKVFEYPKVDSCHSLPAKLPTDAGLIYDEDGKMKYPNVNNKKYDVDLLEYAKYCPVDADPFLPWIHDVFPSIKGNMVHFVAQNKRRCNTGRKHREALHRLMPQVTLLQPVSVARIDEEEAKKLAPDLWQSSSSHDSTSSNYDGMPRYKLVPYEQSKKNDGDFTRFICRFHTIDYDENTNETKDVILGETLSTYPANYEYVNYRKRKTSMLSPKGKENGIFWLSNLRFDCPVPDNGNLRESIAFGNTVLQDGTPSIYVDVVPIRTSPRFGYDNGLFPEFMLGPKYSKQQISLKDHPFPFNRTTNGFNATDTFGEKHVLPLVEASGRWENIPVCNPPPPPPSIANAVTEALKLELSSDSSSGTTSDIQVKKKKEKPHTLSACLWASATFHTRGNDRMVTDTADRIKEWVEYHMLVGFDHIYIYDNTGAHTNETSLREVLAPFTENEVTIIDWPSICCNNNVPAHENPGERSSQYAAESSCRQRYGPYTEWIASIDTDEYLVPMNKFNDMKEVVKHASIDGSQILSFRSTRAVPNYDMMELFYNGGECGKEDNPLCLDKRADIKYIEAYNCDKVPLPKPSWADRAKKQLYRPDYVLSHFVHYSTISIDILQTYEDARKAGKNFDQFYYERNKNERFTNEIEEAVMVHTKTTVPGNTKSYSKTCKFGFVETWKAKCSIGFPIPNNKLDVNASRPDGYKYNCYTNEKLTNHFVPKLREAMKNRVDH